MATPKFDFFFQKSWKSKIWLLTKKWNHPSFVNISPTLVIDTSMESFARVPTTSCKPKNLIYFSKKVWNSKFYLWQRAEITLASSISVLHWLLIHQWKGLHEYYTIKTQKMWKIFKKFKITQKMWKIFKKIKLNSVHTRVVESSWESESVESHVFSWSRSRFFKTAGVGTFVAITDSNLY